MAEYFLFSYFDAPIFFDNNKNMKSELFYVSYKMLVKRFLAIEIGLGFKLGLCLFSFNLPPYYMTKPNK